MIEGRVRAAKNENDAKVSQAWHVERFAREEKLKPLADYLARKSGPPVTADLLAGFEAMRARGVGMVIEALGESKQST